VICPEHTSDLGEAIVHGVLHLVGFDHETDNGEMLALQAELLARGSKARESHGSQGPREQR
jgi:ssRNA-specific RNase YbeY (16S rRNA maturation enzyme)